MVSWSNGNQVSLPEERESYSDDADRAQLARKKTLEATPTIPATGSKTIE